MRFRDANEKGLRVLVALHDDRGAIVLTEDEPEGHDIDFATVNAVGPYQTRSVPCFRHGKTL